MIRPTYAHLLAAAAERKAAVHAILTFAECDALAAENLRRAREQERS